MKFTDGQNKTQFTCVLLVCVGLFFASASAQDVPSGKEQAVNPAQAIPISCPAPAPVFTQEKIAEGSRTARDHGPLWRIEKDGKSSWLYGTIHIAKPDWAFVGPNVVAAMRSADTLAVELNLLDAESLAPLTQPLDKAATSRILDTPRLNRMDKFMAQACLPSGALDALRPSIRANFLLMLDARSEGLYADYGLDLVLLRAAQAVKKPIVALESAADQIKLFSGTSEAEEQEMIDGTLDILEGGNGPAQVRKLTSAWATQDLTILNSYTQWCDCARTAKEKEGMKRMLDDRHPAMVKKISQMHESGQRVFVAVGVLHMIGEQGLPSLMQAQGYKVQLMNAVAKP